MKISCYELVFSDDDKAMNSVAIPLYIDNVFHNWRELQGYIKLYESGLYKKNMTGLFSPKFKTKCGIELDEFIEFVEDNPGFDVYFINPSPQLSYWTYNVWMHGEKAHPGILDAGRALCDAAGLKLPIDKVTQRHTLKTAAYSNFWIASECFWEIYVGGVLMPIVNFLRNNINSKIWKEVHAPTDHIQKSVMLPFIIERLFSTFISENAEIKSVSYNYRMEYVDQLLLNDFESQLLVCGKKLYNYAEKGFLSNRDVAEFMEELTGLYQQHFREYYNGKIHPHSILE